jgi:hypothetical protein
MAAASDQAGEKQPVPTWAIIVAAVALLAFVVWWGIRSFSGPPVAPITGKEKTNQDAIAEIVKRSNGDFSKVSPDDMTKLRQIAGNWAAQAYADVKKKTMP